MPTPQILLQLSIRRNKSAPWTPHLATHRTQRIRQMHGTSPQALCPCLDGFDLPWQQWHAVLMLWLICVIKPSMMMTMLPFKRTFCQPVSRPQSKKKEICTCATFNHSVLQNQNSYIFLFNLLANFTQNVNNGHVSYDVTTNWIKMKGWETERALFKGPILPRLSCKEHL